MVLKGFMDRALPWFVEVSRVRYQKAPCIVAFWFLHIHIDPQAVVWQLLQGTIQLHGALGLARLPQERV